MTHKPQRHPLLATALSVAMLAACGSVEDGADSGSDLGGPDAGLEEGDVTAPEVLSLSPDDGAVGVAPDAQIAVVFSEPMDRSSVEAAWDSDDLPPSAVSFVWNDAGDTLAVVPDEPLELAEGKGLDPDAVTPRAYSFAIGASATDLAGNELADAVSAQFTTPRRLAVELAPIGPLTRTMRGDGVVFGETAVTLVVGDTKANLQTKLFASFEIPELPAGAEIEAATLFGHQNATNGAPYDMGALATLHINAATIDDVAFSGTPLSRADDFSTTSVAEEKAVNVTAQVLDDLANREARGGRTQYRLEFSLATDADEITDEARFSRSAFGLSLIYRVD